VPKINRKLTDTEIRNAKPKDKPYRLYDDGGLRLLVRPTGTKVWQYPYQLHGKENVYTLGQYPQMGASEARKQRDEIRLLVQQGINPNKNKQERYWANMPDVERSFEFIAREWHSKQVWAKKHASNILRTLEAMYSLKLAASLLMKSTPKTSLRFYGQLKAAARWMLPSGSIKDAQRSLTMLLSRVFVITIRPQAGPRSSRLENIIILST